MKVLKWISDNLLLVITLFLLAFIPLYPKLPLIDIKYTWVYIRIEDFIILIAGLAFLIQLIRKKATLKTPLTIPIILFWLIGGLSTLFAVFFIFPYIENSFPTLAFLNYGRRIEYISLFFIAYSAMRNKNFVKPVITILSITLFCVVFYGFAQKGILIGWENRFPAFSTMNEEFAKGIPLRLSTLARVSSTFGGHYDLAAYLVLIIPLMGSMIFGFRNIFSKIIFFTLTTLGLILLLMTASRVSFIVYLLTISFMLILQKQKKFIIPVVVASVILLNSFQGISNRFGSTISQVDLVVDARTGKAVGIAKEQANGGKPVVIEETQLTGENLPQGSGYINIPSGAGTKTITQVNYIRSQIKAGTTSAEITNIQGDFVVKRVLAYDVSFTTRFQGEWPRAFDAFKRNFLLGSGYSSINLATDNDYLRSLGETGVLGFASFILLFLIIAIYVYRVLPDVDTKNTRSFIVGIVAGLFGLGLNAILIDVFEASKVAFVLWMLLGATMGILHLHKKVEIDYLKDIRTLLLSVPAISIYLLIFSFVIFWMSLSNYFVADDFTWLRWVADCKNFVLSSGTKICQSTGETLLKYFTNSDGFFYRPGTKLYFFLMYSFFWLNQSVYHAMSVLFHYATSMVVFIITLRFFRNKLFAVISSVLFLVLSSHSESVLWISSSGHIISAFLILLALLQYMYWKEKQNTLLFLGSILCVVASALFYELGIVAIILILAYEIIFQGNLKNLVKKPVFYLLYFATIPGYLILRYVSHSHWFNGDYSYRLSNLPYNIVGNSFGYLGLSIFGSNILPYYESMRTFGRAHVAIIIIGILVLLVFSSFIIKLVRRKIAERDQQIALFSIVLFIIGLLIYLGLGNITLRYVYLASAGVVLFMVLLLHMFYENFKQHTNIALFFVLGFVAFFSSYHILGLQRVNQDWKRAGEITNKVLVDFNYTYSRQKKPPKNPVFYFVNVPIKTGEAWIFPVGLPDALWFTFQNQNLTVHTEKLLDIALNSAESSTSARVFEFQKDGTIEEVNRFRQTITVPVENKK